MKIISKYKDYYDYLTHIYGIDEKIILDRRLKTTHSFQFFEGETKALKFHICGITYQGACHNGKFYWGEALKELDTRTPAEIEAIKVYDSIILQERSLGFTNYRSKVSVSMVPFEDKTLTNIKEQCPIVYDEGYHKYNYPRLDQFKFNQALPPQDIYLALTAWLSPKDVETKPMSDKEKIVSAGFDLKSSFRGK